MSDRYRGEFSLDSCPLCRHAPPKICSLTFICDVSQLKPTVLKDAFYVFLVSPPPGGSVGVSGLSFSLRERRFFADSGPDPGGGHLFSIFSLASSAAGISKGLYKLQAVERSSFFRAPRRR